MRFAWCAVAALLNCACVYMPGMPASHSTLPHRGVEGGGLGGGYRPQTAAPSHSRRRFRGSARLRRDAAIDGAELFIVLTCPNWSGPAPSTRRRRVSVLEGGGGSLGEGSGGGERGKCLVYVALKNLSQGRRRARCQFKHITVAGSPRGGGEGPPQPPTHPQPLQVYSNKLCVQKKTKKKAADIIMIQSLLGEIAFTRRSVAAAALILLPSWTAQKFAIVFFCLHGCTGSQ